LIGQMIFTQHFGGGRELNPLTILPRNTAPRETIQRGDRSKLMLCCAN